MRFLIFGAGSIGSFLGAMLSGAHEVVLVGRRDHVAAIGAAGLRMEGLDKGSFKIAAVNCIKDLDAVGGGAFDFILVTVKSPGTAEAVKAISTSKGLFGKGTTVVSVQNGLDNVRTLAQAFGDRVLVVLTSHGVLMEAPGTIVHTGKGDTVVGWPVTRGRKRKRSAEEERRKDAAVILTDALTEAGIESRVSEDMAREMWLKAAVNAGINPICAIIGLENRYLLEVPALAHVWQAAVKEVAAVARSEGIEISDEEALKRTRTVAELTGDNKCSMLQDVERCRRTEVDSITGLVIRTGERNGVPVPVSATLLGLVKGIEKTYLK